MSSMLKTMKATLPIIINIEPLDDPLHWIGYKIVMSDSTKDITCKIENSHKCCEKWGVYTKSNLNEFIDAEYLSIDVSKIKKKKNEDMRMVDITITTNRGNISLQLYNEHNGYYSHEVFIESEKGINILKV
jgi:hypothetical protein